MNILKTPHAYADQLLKSFHDADPQGNWKDDAYQTFLKACDDNSSPLAHMPRSWLVSCCAYIWNT